MKIQIISNRDFSEWKECNEVFIASVKTSRALDDFDVNIIDMSCPWLWRCSQERPMDIDLSDDVWSLREMVCNKHSSSIVIVWPENTEFLYDYNIHVGQYNRKEQIKNCLETVCKIINQFAPIGYMSKVCFENTLTSIGGIQYKASFWFKRESVFEELTSSEKSKKTTTIKYPQNIFFTTLQIFDSETTVKEFVNVVSPEEVKEEVPEWVKGIEILDDKEQRQSIENAEGEIEKLKVKILEAKEKLNTNMKLKSILYSSGQELVEVVFYMLEQLLLCDLSNFIDEKKEDFLIQKNDYTLIGEIKGVSNNVTSAYVSQVENHFQEYQDKLSEKGIKENVRQIFIINPLRKIPVSEREPIHETQVRLAYRNNCLIIETKTLLRMYEEFISGRITHEDCERIFAKHEGGLLKDTDLYE